MDTEGIIHILNTNLQDILSGKTNVKESSLLCMNEENVYCLLMEQHKILIQSRIDKNIQRLKYESTDPDEPFYFPSDIKQFECANGKFIWLNKTKLQILNEKSGEVIKSIDLTADKFVLDSQNQIYLINQAAHKLQVYQIDGSLLAEYQVEENLINQSFFLDKPDKFVFFNKNTFDLHLQ